MKGCRLPRLYRRWLKINAFPSTSSREQLDRMVSPQIVKKMFIYIWMMEKCITLGFNNWSLTRIRRLETLENYINDRNKPFKFRDGMGMNMTWKSETSTIPWKDWWPNLGIDIVNLGLIYEIRFDGDNWYSFIRLSSGNLWQTKFMIYDREFQ